MKTKRSIALAAAAAVAFVAFVPRPVLADYPYDGYYDNYDYYDYDDYDDYGDYSTTSIDFSTIGLASTEITVVAEQNWDDSYYSSGRVVLTGVPDGAYLDDEDIKAVTSSNPTIQIDPYDCYFDGNEISFNVSGIGKATITLTIGTKQLSFNLTVVEPVYISESSILLAKGKSTTIKLGGDTRGATITYTSLSPSVASVSSSGKVTGKSAGCAVIKVSVDYKGTVEDLGTVVNVASQKKIDAYKYARSYSSKSTYSQAKRMQDGYYDCSSLVWRSYKSKGIYLMNKYYAPTAADLAKYLVGQGKTVGKATTANARAGKFQVGDLLFQAGENNGRYKGIYHVEMFGGYSFYNFDSDGSYYLGLNFATKGDGTEYGLYGTGNIVCRP